MKGASGEPGMDQRRKLLIQQTLLEVRVRLMSEKRKSRATRHLYRYRYHMYA